MGVYIASGDTITI